MHTAIYTKIPKYIKESMHLKIEQTVGHNLVDLLDL